MAKLSKTQRAKKSAARAARKERAEEAEQVASTTEIAAAPVEEKKRCHFVHDVKAEMKRVTWPSRTDVLRWSGVVVAALLFFGVYVFILDNAVVTPLLVAISSIGA